MENQPHFSASADKNKSVILEQLQTVLPTGAHVLEIASGTAQHALHFAKSMPEVLWQTSDRDVNTYGLAETVQNAAMSNVPEPLELDVMNWPETFGSFDAVYSANCIHVMPEDNLAPYVVNAAKCLSVNGLMLLYGPFRYNGAFTTPSNEEFSRFLAQTYEGGGIRDFEMVDQLARDNGLAFISDTDMPANNQFLVWQKQESGA